MGKFAGPSGYHEPSALTPASVSPASRGEADLARLLMTCADAAGRLNLLSQRARSWRRPVARGEGWGELDQHHRLAPAVHSAVRTGGAPARGGRLSPGRRDIWP